MASRTFAKGLTLEFSVLVAVSPPRIRPTFAASVRFVAGRNCKSLLIVLEASIDKKKNTKKMKDILEIDALIRQENESLSHRIFVIFCDGTRYGMTDGSRTAVVQIGRN